MVKRLLMLAAKYGSLDLILLLLNNGADVNKANGFGLTFIDDSSYV